MQTVIESIILGIYLPIVVYSGAACWLFVTRWLWPAWKKHTLSVDNHAIGIAAVFALLAHLTENLWYGVARWFDKWDMLNNQLVGVGAWKLLILASCVFAFAALDREVHDWHSLSKITRRVAYTWVIGAVLARLFAN